MKMNPDNKPAMNVEKTNQVFSEVHARVGHSAKYGLGYMLPDGCRLTLMAQLRSFWTEISLSASRKTRFKS